MKQNITLRLDRELIRKSKVMAAERHTSVSKMLSRELERMVNRDRHYRAAKRKALTNLGVGFQLGGGDTPSRGQLHER